MAAGLAGMLAGCGPAAGGSVSTPATPPAPRVTLTTLVGQHLTVPNGRAAVLYFVSAQCSSCVDGLHQLTALQGQVPKTVQWLAVDVTPQYDPASAVSSMLAETGARWPAAYATNQVLQAYHVTALDQLAVIGADGRLLYDGGRPSDGVLRRLLDAAQG
ncbi:MAG: hypothetical protein K6U87_07130 [Firmicutes bacterium]|nr:hypothetical protein [Bacillota bacterium]